MASQGAVTLQIVVGLAEGRALKGGELGMGERVERVERVSE